MATGIPVDRGSRQGGRPQILESSRLEIPVSLQTWNYTEIGDLSPIYEAINLQPVKGPLPRNAELTVTKSLAKPYLLFGPFNKVYNPFLFENLVIFHLKSE